MLRNNRSGLMAAAAVGAGAAGAFALWRRTQAARQRQKMLARGEIRELREVWKRVGSYRVFARVGDTMRRDGVLPVVLVHGWGMSSAYWVPTAERLANEFSVYVPDLPGHGRSDTPLQPFSIRFLARVLFRWMNCMGLVRVTLVGHSMGCQVAAEAALQDPSRVDRLVLIGLASDPEGRSVAEQFRRLAGGSVYERPALGRHSARDLLRVGRRLVPEFRFMMDHHIEEKLPRITQPVMLVRGEKDRVAPQRWIDDAARLVGTDRVTVIPSWGHAVQFSAPEETVAAIRPFLRERLW
jgi:2-hydroxy-6-oxonona-2,4-dienedioate hydrolase